MEALHYDARAEAVCARCVLTCFCFPRAISTLISHRGLPRSCSSVDDSGDQTSRFIQYQIMSFLAKITCSIWSVQRSSLCLFPFKVASFHDI